MLLIHSTTWRNLNIIMLNERNLSEKITYFMITSIWHSWKNKTLVMGRDQWFTEGWGGGGVYLERDSWGDGNVLYPDCRGAHVNMW